MNRLPGKIYLLTLLIALLAPGPAWVQGMIWCIDAEGASRLEYAPQGCNPGESCSEETSYDKGLSPATDEHCDSCLDLPATSDSYRFSSPLRSHSNTVLHFPPVVSILFFSPGILSAINGIRPPPEEPIAATLLSLQTIVLLI